MTKILAILLLFLGSSFLILTAGQVLPNGSIRDVLLCYYCKKDSHRDCTDHARDALTVYCTSKKCGRVEDSNPDGSSSVGMGCHNRGEDVGCRRLRGGGRIACVCDEPLCNAASVNDHGGMGIGATLVAIFSTAYLFI